MNYILFNSYDYPKPEHESYMLGQIFGDGTLLDTYLHWQLYDRYIKGLYASKEMSTNIRYVFPKRFIYELLSNTTIAQAVGQFYCITLLLKTYSSIEPGIWISTNTGTNGNLRSKGTRGQYFV